MDTIQPPQPITKPPPAPSLYTPAHHHTSDNQTTTVIKPTSDTDPHITASNQTPYRLTLINKAKETAKKFLGKFYFGNNVLTEILPPVIASPTTHRDLDYILESGKKINKLCRQRARIEHNQTLPTNICKIAYK